MTDPTQRQMGRKLIVDAKPNRLFLKYLAEWRDDASDKGDKSSYTFSKAYKSLQKYPLPLQCGEEAKILENFGDKICKMLDTRLGKDADENDQTPTEYLEQSRKVPESWWEKVNKELPDAGKPIKKRSKRKKEATKDGEGPSKQKKIILDYIKSTLESNAYSNSSGGFTLKPGEFDVVLCVDTRETMGESCRKEIGRELNHQNVFYEQRTLQIGDFLWIAQEKPGHCQGHPPKELVLDYVVERKILSDLAMSIRDGRFREQKIRLKQSGLENIIYLIENITDIENQSLPESTLRQASYNTQIVDNICVKYTENARATVRYLKLMTKRLQKKYGGCSLEAGEVGQNKSSRASNSHVLMQYSEFNEMSSKHRKLKVKEMFIRHLMQVHGISYDKASAVTSTYATPLSLIQAYRELESDKHRDELLSCIKFGLTQRNLGIAISRSVSSIYS